MEQDMPQYKRVFVLGSGFSKSFSSQMPTIKNLTEAIFKKEIIGPLRPDCTTLFKYINTFNEINDKNENNINKIENLTTTIFSRRIFESQLEEQYYEQLKYEILRYIYFSIKPHKIDRENKEILQKFLEACTKEHAKGSSFVGKNLLITFNYDLLLEEFISNYGPKMGVNIDYGIQFNEHTIFSHVGIKYSTRPFQYIKLHGSFNWFKAKGASSIDINSIFKVNPWDENSIIYENDNPIFIPMAHGKELFLYGTLYNFLWVKAFNYLSDAREIYFIGYGFPETDINNLIYFWQFRHKIKNIIVYYENDNDPELLRLRKLFGSNIVKNVDAKKFISDNMQIFYTFK